MQCRVVSSACTQAESERADCYSMQSVCNACTNSLKIIAEFNSATQSEYIWLHSLLPPESSYTEVFSKLNTSLRKLVYV